MSASEVGILRRETTGERTVTFYKCVVVLILTLSESKHEPVKVHLPWCYFSKSHLQKEPGHDPLEMVLSSSIHSRTRKVVSYSLQQ